MHQAITVHAPASKSLSHRTLMAAALSNGESIVKNVLESQDLMQTMSILTATGASFEKIEEGVYKVLGNPPRGSDTKDAPTICDVHESGTSCRLLTAIIASGEGFFRIQGAPRMYERPMGILTDALEKLGTEFSFDKKGYPPFTMHAHGLNGGEITLNLEESSQYLSGILLAAPFAKTPLTIYIGGRHVVSWPYIGLTLQVMKRFGANFDVSILNKKKSTPTEKVWSATDWHALTEIIPGEIRFRVRPFKEGSAYKAATYTVEGDWSGASYLLAAGVLGKKPVSVCGLNRNSLQADIALLSILEKMRAKISYGDVANPHITTHPSELFAVDVNMSDCPDLVPTVAVLASFAHGTSKIYGIEHLRIKESDRLNALATELSKAGVHVIEEKDGLIIEGKNPHKPLTQAFIASQATSCYGIREEKPVENIEVSIEENIAENIAENSTNIENQANLQTNPQTNTALPIDNTPEKSPLDCTGQTLHFNAYGDHRIVMSLALFKLAGATIDFDDPSVINKSFPQFWDIWKTICG